MDSAENPRKWYKKKRYVIPSALFGLFLLLGSGDTSSNVPASAVSVPQEASVVESSTQTKEELLDTSESEDKATEVKEGSNYSPQTKTSSNSSLSNDDYYTNVNGDKIHSPAYAPSIPAGASAQCRDGTYSFSANRRGTCSHHGGVATWY